MIPITWLSFRKFASMDSLPSSVFHILWDNCFMEETLPWQRVVRRGASTSEISLRCGQCTWHWWHRDEGSMERESGSPYLPEAILWDDLFLFSSFLLPGPSTWQKPYVLAPGPKARTARFKGIPLDWEKSFLSGLLSDHLCAKCLALNELNEIIPPYTIPGSYSPLHMVAKCCQAAQ